MTIRVAVKKLISESWGGTIFAAQTDEGRSFHVRTSSTTSISVGDVFDVEGEVCTHKTQWSDVHQIEATDLVRVRTSGRLIVPWLMSLDGIGRDRAERLFSDAGCNLIPMLAEPSRVAELAKLLSPTRPNLGQKLAEYVQAQYAKRAAREDVGLAEVAFLQKLEELGINDPRLARKLWRLIGSRDAYHRLLERPYLTAAVLPWKDADELGQRLLHAGGHTFLTDHPERQMGAVDALWLRILKRGDTAAARPDFLSGLSRLGVDPEKCLLKALENRRAVEGPDGFIRAPGAAFLEASVADHIRRIRDAQLADLEPGQEPAQHRSSLNDEQLNAVRTLGGAKFGILQGGAGVGKTTTTRALCDAHAEGGKRVLLTAISGKAALRLSRATGRLAYTVARLVHGLERRAALADASQAVPEILPSIGADTLLVVDEASMVDLASWRRLLQFVPTGAKVVLVGDVAQLPPVGLGRVYHDLVEHGVGVVHLSKVMRQAGGNPIIRAAAAIRAGTIPELSSYSGIEPGLFHVPARSNLIAAEALRIYSELVRSTSRDQLLMLAARNDTCAMLAKTMQLERLSRGHVGIRLGPLAQWVAVGDPVVATVNRYDQALMNGLIGWVETLEPLTIRFDGEEEAREVTGQARHELASAWCLTVHRAQGSEAERVIILLDGPTLITREWLYTAVTRGGEQVVLIGPAENIRLGVERVEGRRTAFHQALRQADAHL